MKYNVSVLKQISFNKIYIFLICLVIFLIPANLFFKVNPASAYVNGLLVDYLIPKFYASDVPIIFLLSLWLIEVIKSKQKVILKTSSFILPSILASLFIIRQIFTPYPLAAAWYLLKLIEVGLLAWFLVTHSKFLKKSSIYWTIIFTTLFQSSLALWQFFTQKSLLGFSFLGEPNLAKSIGLAKDMWWYTGRVLPYATTAHPNILGGILAVFSLFIIAQKRHKILTAVVVSLALAIIIMTQSISALTSLTLGVLLLTLKPYYQKISNISDKLLIGFGATMIVLPLLINLAANLFEADSLTRRSYLQSASIRMFLDNLTTGVGLNQFTTRVEEFSDTQEVVRFIQPVHHIGLLWIAETGILGILLSWTLIKKINTKKIVLPFLILLPIATLDHYLLTQQSGLLLAVFMLSHPNYSLQDRR